MCLKIKQKLPTWDKIIEPIKPERVGSKFIVISGKQRVGKTSLGNAIIKNNFRFYNKDIVSDAREIADRLNVKYNYKLNIAEHLIFTSSPLVLSKKRNLVSHLIDVPRFGLPNKQFKVQYFPYGSFVFIMEADILMNCRDYKDLNMFLLNLLKYFGHMNLTIIFDCQSIGRLDKAIQEIITDIFFVYDRDVEDISFIKNDKEIHTKKYTWHYLHIDNQNLRMQKEFSGFNFDLKIKPVKEETYTFIGDIHKFYKSRSATPYFYQDIEKYEYLEHVKAYLDKDSVDQFCELHPLVRPEDIKKSSKTA